MLVRADFTANQIQTGAQVGITFEWKSAGATTVFLNFDASQFSVVPTSFPLEATTGGSTATRVEQVTVTKLVATAQFCDVHFVQGASDRFDTVEVL